MRVLHFYLMCSCRSGFILILAGGVKFYCNAAEITVISVIMITSFIMTSYEMISFLNKTEQTTEF